MDWPWRVGDRIHFLRQTNQRTKRSIQGKIIALTDDFVVVDTGKYRETLHRAEWQIGETKAQRLG